jgi:CHAD domain-containing protein
MVDIPVHFELPGNLNIGRFMDSPPKNFSWQLTEQYYVIRTFYDCFDWRLYNANLLCEFNQAKKFSELSLINYGSGQLIARLNIEKIPPFISELDDSPLTQQLLPLLGVRALLPLVHLNLQVYQLNIFNHAQKTVAHLRIEEYEDLRHRVTLKKIKGYNKVATQLNHFLSDTLGLKPVTKPVFVAALKIQGRKPGDYSSKLNIKLKPDLPAPQAVKTIYKQLLETIKINEQGTINAIDSEFLHDFRVAIRRTRAGLGQFQAVLPNEISHRYSEYFAWLGQITSPLRDLDVYVANFDLYKSSLPPAMREDLNPLHEFLKLKQSAAQKELATQLQSKEYLTNLLDWENYLNQSAISTADEKNATLSIKQLADLRIWKVYQRVIKHGSLINDKSPPISLHNLRKTCKKLRYLIEFFQSFYPAEKIKLLINALKELQELLGDFQDCAVQEQTLKHFSDEMHQSGCCLEQTFLAIAALIEVLDVKSCKARNDFAKHFAIFAASENRIIFKSLFVNNV